VPYILSRSYIHIITCIYLNNFCKNYLRSQNIQKGARGRGKEICLFTKTPNIWQEHWTTKATCLIPIDRSLSWILSCWLSKHACVQRYFWVIKL